MPKFACSFLRVFFVLALGACCCALFASDSDGFDDEFSSDEEDIVVVQSKSESKSNLKISGSLSNRIFYNYSHHAPIKKPNQKSNDFRGFSSFKNSINLDVEYKYKKAKLKSTMQAFYESIYDIKSEQYAIVPDTYQSEAQINELFYTQNFGNVLDITLGRIIVGWGKSDGINIVDNLNPIDNKEAGLVDIKDLKLGRGMLRVELTNPEANSKYEAILLFENRYSKLPQYGSDFAMAFLPQKGTPKNKPALAPSSNIDNIGVAFSYSKSFNAKDIAFYYSHQYIDGKNYKEHMLGASYSGTYGSFLLKGEGAIFAKECNLFECKKTNTNSIQSRADGMVGISYNGITDGSILFELANKNDLIQYFMRFSQSYINQTLNMNLVYGGYGGAFLQNAFARASLEYLINDNLKTSIGIIDYMGGEIKQIENIKNNDRVFLTTTYSF